VSIVFPVHEYVPVNGSKFFPPPIYRDFFTPTSIRKISHCRIEFLQKSTIK